MKHFLILMAFAANTLNAFAFSLPYSDYEGGITKPYCDIRVAPPFISNTNKPFACIVFHAETY